jgi:AraC-like DNA-binding protein
MFDRVLNIQVILDSIGFVQGATLGVLLIVLNKRKFKSTFFVGLFLLLFSMELATWLSVNLKISDRYPELFLLPFNFSWLLFPLFFVYTQHISILSDQKIKYWLLYPGILSFLAQVFIFSLPYETKVVIEESSWHQAIFWMLGNYYSWIIGAWNLWLLYKHRIEVENTYSYLDFKELKWAKYFLIYLLATSIYGHLIAYVFPEYYKDNTIFSIMDLIAIYWVAYFGISQRNIRGIMQKNRNLDKTQEVQIDEDEPSIKDVAKLTELLSRIQDHMKSTEKFTDPELTIMDLAEGVSAHPKLVSTSINTLTNQNFNSYVNKFRIEKAQELFKTRDLETYSIEGIGQEVGFHSKSTFYSAFKKETGTTPIKYYKEAIIQT